MKKTLLALALAAVPFVSSASESNGIGYNHVQLDYVYEDAYYYGNGAAISGSYAFTDNFFVTGRYARTTDDVDSWLGDFDFSAYDLDIRDVDVDLAVKNWSVGIGFNKAIGDRADWVSQLAYARKEVDADITVCGAGGCVSDSGKVVDYSGYNLSTGVRGRVTDALSANAYLGYEDYNHHYDGDFYADFGLGYAFNPTWSLQTGVRLADSTQTWNLGVRASF